MKLRADNFSLKHTIESAQPLTFFGDIRHDGNGVVYASKGSLVEVEQKKRTLSCTAYGGLSNARLKKEIVDRFGLDDDAGKIYRQINTDSIMSEAIRRYGGMRITKNEPWEATLCFLISQFNNVKRIRGIVKRLIDSYGEQKSFEAGNVALTFREFPSPEAIAQRSVGDLIKHGAGFRARYIKEAARMCVESFELDRLYRKKYADAKGELVQLPGVGDKVADCILLFGYKKLEAFPIDTWIKRVVEKEYFKGKKQSLKKIHEFADEKWGAYAGYAQQYLYHFARNE